MWWMLEDIIDEVRYSAAEAASKCSLKICEAKNAALYGKPDNAYDDGDECEDTGISISIGTRQPVYLKPEKCNSEGQPD